MKNIYTKSILALLIVFSFSCEDLNEDINANPNDILTTDVEDKLFLTENYKNEAENRLNAMQDFLNNVKNQQEV